MTTSLFARLNGVSILARDDLDLGRRDHFIRLHLERGILHNEGPYIVAQTVRVEVTLHDMIVT